MWSLLLVSAYAVDSDGDGVPDRRDGCDRQRDPRQVDADGDGFGDACDVCPGSGAGLELLSAPLAVAAIEAPVAVLGTDLDGDGDADLAVGTTSGVAWVENLGGGRFGPVVVADDGLGEVRDLEVGDLDGDGTSDLVAATADGIVALPIGAGLGAASVLLAEADALDVAVGDLDGDHDGDLVVGAPGGASWYPREGGGFGAAVRLSAAYGSDFHVAVGDLDLDGDADLLTSGSGTDLFLNDGAGPGEGARISSVAGALSLADLDGDGPLDVVVSSRDGVTELLSEAGGVWAIGPVVPLAPVVRGAAVGEVDGTAPPEVVVVSDLALTVLMGGGLPRPLGPALAQGSAVAAVDLTGDGLADLVVADRLAGELRLAPSQASCRELDRDGDGLTDVAELLEHGTDAAAADTDGDGVSDGDERARGLDPTDGDSDGDGRADGADVCPADPTDPDEDGDGVCQTEDTCPLQADPAQADADGDGFGDACDLCPGLGAGLTVFGAALPVDEAAADRGSAPPPVDLDLDGDLDLVWPALGIRENLGSGRFAARPSPTLGSAVLAADVDGDGLPDLVTDVGSGVAVARNLGGLVFAPAQVLTSLVRADDLAAGDLDADGDLDLVACSRLTNRMVMRNAGDLQFVSQQLGWADDCSQVEVGDLDGDGDDDIVADTWFEGLSWWERSGPNFRRHPISTRFDLDDLALGDLDADGDPDLAIGWFGEVSVAENRRGQLVRRHASQDLRIRLAIGDLDGDGLGDLVASREALDAFVHLGAWRFSPPVPIVDPGLGVVVAGDLDGDGDDDPVLGAAEGLGWYPSEVSCVVADTDADRLTDPDEVHVLGTDPRVADSDGGGAGDGDEVELGTDPLDPADDVVTDGTGSAPEGSPPTSSTTSSRGGRAPAPVARVAPTGCAVSGVALPAWLVLLAPLALLGRRSRPRPSPAPEPVTATPSPPHRGRGSG